MLLTSSDALPYFSRRLAMSDAVHHDRFRRELAHRVESGLDVTLYWHPSTGALTVCVVDDERQDYFELDADPSNALAVYYHPFVYADAPHLFVSAA
jgi:hypothetical protein